MIRISGCLSYSFVGKHALIGSYLRWKYAIFSNIAYIFNSLFSFPLLISVELLLQNDTKPIEAPEDDVDVEGRDQEITITITTTDSPERGKTYYWQLSFFIISIFLSISLCLFQGSIQSIIRKCTYFFTYLYLSVLQVNLFLKS